MDFFQHQQDARRNTGLLVLLFSLAVVAIVALVVLVASLALYGALPWQKYSANGALVEHGVLLNVAGLVVAGIAVVMLIRWLSLRGGGHVVAERLGGERIDADTQNFQQRQLLNVVEEMALAANMPVPAVYVLPHETGINAFAAGYQSKDAIIGVTQGALDTFDREQLQGVIAHEFSHILNGDMRLNIRLMAVIAGIIFLAHAGRILLYVRGGGGRNRNNALPLIGLALIVVGAVGVLFGNMIKAAVSRQREFLADSAAVQFTRNPEGLAGALKQIGARQQGSTIEHKNADEAEHLFFGQALNHWFSLMSTHPPLNERIKRIQPDWDGNYPAPQRAPQQDSQPHHHNANAATQQQGAKVALAAAVMESLHQPAAVTQQLDKVIDQPAQFKAGERIDAINVAMTALRQLPDKEQQQWLDGLRQRILSNSQEIGYERIMQWGLYQLLAWQLSHKQRSNRTLSSNDAEKVSMEILYGASLEDTSPVLDEALLAIEKALNQLRQQAPKDKGAIIQRWLQQIHRDGVVTDAEQRLVVVLAACIDANLPEHSFA